MPVVLVTSRSSEEGKSAGVEAYIVEGAFDRGNPIATIEQPL